MAAASQAGRDSLVACLARVAADLKLLRGEVKNGRAEPQSLEDRLRRLDDEMLAAARASIPPGEQTRLEAEADRALGSAALRMTPEAGEATRRAHLARLLRREAGLPRLTLFD